MLNCLGQAVPAAGFRLSMEDGAYMEFAGSEIPLHLQVSLVPQPLSPDALRKALSSPFRQMTSPGLEEDVERHSMHVLITVRSESPIVSQMLSAVPDDLARSVTAMLGKSLDEFPAGAVEAKMTICYLVSHILVEWLRPAAIYWNQSDQLLSPDSFHRNSDHGFPAPLHIHPYLYSSGTAPDGRRITGFVTLGARHVIGREIRFKECAASFPWMYGRALMLLKMAYDNDRNVIPDGDTFGVGTDEIIRVRHIPETNEEVAMLELTVEKSIEHGIGTSPPPPQGGFGHGHGSPGRPVFGRRKPN
jgi:hypothetical protein